MDLVDNDDLFVVIVGDEGTEDNIEKQVIKCEVDESTCEIAVEDLIDTAEKYGQSIDIGIDKQEVEDQEEMEYIDNQNDEDYIQDFSDEYSDDEYLSDKNKSTFKSKEMPRHKMRAPHEQQSFVNELLQEHPELAEDNELLINKLSQIMLSTKRPPPPKDFFIMNNIMFECVVCGVKAETMPAVERHWQEKHGPRYLICYACGVDFRSTTNLYKHEKRCNAPDAETVLKARARTLGRKARGRPFIGKIKYENKRFPCSQCSAHFSTNESLQSHEFKHSGARPFRCKKCPAAYTSSSGLYRHSIKHTDIQFICDDCGRSFKSKAALIVHLDTHKPLRKYACEECGRRFAQKMARQLHVDRVHRHLPPPCACQVCHKRYPKMSLLKVHMLQKHGMKLITRNMFHRLLPHLSDSELKKIKVVKKICTKIAPSVQSEQIEEIANESKDIELFEQEIYIGSVKSEEFRSQFNKEDETEQFEYTDFDMTEEENNIQETHHIDIPKETVVYENKLSREGNIATSAIDEPEINEDKVEKPSDYLMEYAKQLQRSSRPKPFVVMKDGQAIFIDENNIDFYKRNVVTEVKQHTVNSEPKTEVTTSLLPQTNTMIKEKVASSSVTTVNTKMRPTLQSPKIKSKTRGGRKNAKSK